MFTMPRVGNVLISYCGIVCEYCPAYRLGKCPGCDAHAEYCEFIKCTKRRGVDNCLLCSEFPCKLHIEGFNWVTEEFGELKWKVYSEIFLQIMKKIVSKEQH